MKPISLCRGMALLIVLIVSASLFACDAEKGIANFPHHPHLEAGLDCAFCHQIQQETITMPPFSTCLGCHEEQDDRFFGECRACHQQHGVVMGAGSQDYHGDFFDLFKPDNLKDVTYNHADFPVESDAECLQCHVNIKTARRSSFDNIPTMKQAMAFHDLKGYSNECRVCHEVLDVHTAPLSHDNAWPHTHGRLMVFEDKDSCLLCHQEETCFACHSTMKPRDHTNLFRRKTHGIAASFDRGACITCHRQDECLACHLATASPISPAPYHTPDASCLSCHSPLAAQGPPPRPPRELLHPMPHRMMMGVTARTCLECHIF